jgi:hypothetical protein
MKERQRAWSSMSSAAAAFKAGDRVRLVAPGRPAHGFIGSICLRPGAEGVSVYADLDRPAVNVLFEGMKGTILAVPVAQLEHVNLATSMPKKPRRPSVGRPSGHQRAKRA